MNRVNYSTQAPWEETVGYSRAVKVGPHLFISGTTATQVNGEVAFPGDAYRQTVFILETIKRSLEQAGGNLQDVVRTRMFVTNIDDWQAIGRAHGEFFADVRPCATMVEISRLIHEDHLVEIEADAIIAESRARK